MAIVRRPLREEVYRTLVEKLLSGELAPGSRINEQELCADLGVSRTPLREGLIRLEQDGFLYADMAKGFTVQPLSVTEVLEVYPIIWTLESFAIRLAGPAMKDVVPELQGILDEMRAQPPEAFTSVEQLDLAFHAKLREGCGNERLKEMVANLRRVGLRYEIDYWITPELRLRSIREHQAIIDLLAAGETEPAISVFVEHWRGGMEHTLKRLKERLGSDA
jgi:DNA-binding GntR family transcriptional regulator